MNNLDKTINTIAGFIEIAATTAPKTRGTNNLLVKTITKNELNEFADKMILAGKNTERPQTFTRDSESVRLSSCAVIIGTKYSTLGLNCGFCGFAMCIEAEEKNTTCAYNSCDLGIALCSAVTTASRFHLDNRIMYTIGYTAIINNIFGEEVRMALGIPLSATEKNPYFDRK